MNIKNNIVLSKPEFPQSDSNNVINILEVKTMGIKYLVMKVNKYDGVELLDSIDGELYLKDNSKIKIKSITYCVTPDVLDNDYDYYSVIFNVNDFHTYGLYEAVYTVTSLNDNKNTSPISSVNIIEDPSMNASDNEITFTDIKNRKLYLSSISRERGIRIRTNFKGFTAGDTITITLKILDEENSPINTLKSDKVLLQDQVNQDYADYTISTGEGGINFVEAKSILAGFYSADINITSSLSQISIYNDLDNVNVKVQLTQNIGTSSESPDVKPFLTAVVYTGSNSNAIIAQVSNAYFSDGSNRTPLGEINNNGVGYLNIYSKDIAKNSVLTLNYLDPVNAYKVCLNFSVWLLSSSEEIKYTYSSYGVADGTCQCFLFIEPLITGIETINVKFDTPDIIIDDVVKSSIPINNPVSNKTLSYKITSNKAFRANFSINASGKGIYMEQINNTIVFVDPLTFE
ncbi:hypothetical protein XBJ2_1450002 [Xenorhabdus bovienii str. Jollieti]|uniref:Uncharacterized protein n=1 Tax=Xenorhabdus bovienii (strain SS-2004) TaxID=406818 RepID=D3V7N5_XENBS|nr:hypothetical protein [Xenorhabdus bovienii]CBJ81847.1 hypothetical protein XBJ1_2723 [Xenorhabdus bovienii SS-2004]CDH27699.1 hypothetical protein XBJ2_1450002 [Xenorhabdus bovienii str. Jollieti]